MVHTSILTEQFIRDAQTATRQAREATLAAGHSVFFLDDAGRYVEELPDGRRFEVRLENSKSTRIRELTRDAA
ncbi:MAG: hypothetical protein JST65_09540 [Acidobacteria bacterium]|nr:hypothetical protein [Acidobacteriota bacterium]